MSNPAEPWFEYAETRAPASIGHWVACFWRFEALPGLDRPAAHTVWPDGCLSLALATGGGPELAVFAGPHVGPLEMPIAPGRRYVGVRFRPDTGAAFLGVPAANLLDRTGLLEALAPGLAEGFRSAARTGGVNGMTSWIERRVAGMPVPDPLAQAAVLALDRTDGTIPITRLARELGASLRQLQRRFKAATGHTPKQYARIRRFRAAGHQLLATNAPRPAALAADTGFYDQAHLSNELQTLTGLTPAAFQQRLRTIRHRDIIR